MTWFNSAKAAITTGSSWFKMIWQRNDVNFLLVFADWGLSGCSDCQLKTS